MTETNSLTRKRVILYFAIAYLISYLMMIPMYIGKQKGLDIVQIVNAQMCSPAAAVALGFLVFYKGEKQVPKLFMWTLIVNYVIQLVLGLLSVFANPFSPDQVIDLADILGTSGDTYAITGVSTEFKPAGLFLTAGECLIMASSVVLWIGYFTARKKGREFAGLCRKNEVKGIVLILLFVALYTVRIVGPTVLEGLLTNSMSDVGAWFRSILDNPLFYISLIDLPVKYPLLIVAFLGEEYGWRYFLQPVMMKKFGKRAGIILLGVVWGLWHIPVDTMYYTVDSIPQMIIGQIITCIAVGIFFGWVYLKTENIWIPVCMHYLNNNLIPVLTGTFTADVMQDQHVPWGYLIEILLFDFVLFGIFIFAKEFREKKKAKEAIDA